MGTDVDLTSTAARCPSCNAALRPDAPWCSLCLHDLRPAPAPAAVVVPAPSQPLYGAQDPLTAPLLDLVLPPVPEAAAVAVPELPVAPAAGPVATWPCVRCQAANAITELRCTVCGAAFLDGGSTPQSLVVPGLGDLSRYSRGQRVGLACAVAVALLIPLALVTYLLTPHSVATQGTPGTTTTTTTTP